MTEMRKAAFGRITRPTCRSVIDAEGAVSSAGEHRPYKPGVTGSNPVPPTRRGHWEIDVGVVVQLVRTPACQAGGREFESRRPRHSNEAVQNFV